MLREDKHHHNAIAVRQANGRHYLKCIGCRESKRKMRMKWKKYRCIEITDKLKTKKENKKNKKKQRNVLNTCVSIYFNHTNTCLKSFPTTGLISMRYKNRLALNNLLHFCLLFIFWIQCIFWRKRFDDLFSVRPNEEESSVGIVGVRYDHGRHWIECLSRWSTVDSLSFNIWNRSSSNLVYWINELVSVTHCGLKKIK